MADIRVGVGTRAEAVGASAVLLFLLIVPFTELLMITVSLAVLFFSCSLHWKNVTRANVFDVGVFAILFSSCASTLFSQNLNNSLFYLGRVVEAVSAYLIVRSFQAHVRHKSILVVCCYGALRSGLIALYWGVHYIQMWNAGFRNFLPLRRAVLALPGKSYSGNESIVFLILVGIGCYVVHTNHNKNRLADVIGWCCVLTNILCLQLTLSRISYLSIGTAAGIYLLWRMFDRCGWPLSWRLPVVISITLVVAASTLFSMKLAGGLTMSNAWSQRISLASRIRAQRSSLEQYRHHLFTGTGPDTFSFEDCISGDLAEGTCHSQAFAWPAQVISEQGLFGIGALVIIGCTLVTAYRRAVNKTNIITMGIIVSCIVAVVVFSFGQSAPFYSETISNFIFIVLGFMVVHSPKNPKRIVSTTGGTYLIATLGLVVIIGGVETMRASSMGGRADKVTAAIRLNEDAIRVCNHRIDWEQTAFYGVVQSTQIEAARQCDSILASAILDDPTNDTLWHNRAWIQLAFDNVVEAEHCLDMAEKLSPGDYIYLVSDAMFARLRARRNEEVIALARAIAIEPAIINSILVERLKAEDPGMLSTAEQLAQSHLVGNSESPINRAKDARILYSRNEYRSAQDELKTSLETYPGMVNAWKLLEIIQSRMGEVQDARETAKKLGSFHRASEPEGPTTSITSTLPAGSTSVRNARFFYRYKHHSKGAESLIPSWLELSLDSKD